MNILIDDPEIADNFPEGTRESVQSCKCPRQYFGWGEMKKMNQIELMEKLLEINKCQGCHKVKQPQQWLKRLLFLLVYNGNIGTNKNTSTRNSLNNL